MKEKKYTKYELNQMVLDFEKHLKGKERIKNVEVGDWECYSHSGGIYVEGYKEKQWVYFPEY